MLRPILRASIKSWPVRRAHVPRMTLAPTRAYNTVSQQRSNRWKSAVLAAGGLSILSLGLWWFYWPHHSFPRPVAKLLRKALWAESDKKGHNFQEALGFYIDALEECEHLDIDRISDEYTGIQLKIAEMYEKLNMFKEAQSIYLEMLHQYYEALITNGRVPEWQRPHYIQKDLRVLIKALEMNQDLQLGKRLLLTHLMLPQEEVLMRSPELKKFFDRRKEEARNAGDRDHSQPQRWRDFKPHVNEENIKLDDKGNMILDLQKDSSAWQPFKEEFFTARDLYTVYCLSTDDLPSALSCKMTTVEWMVMADMPPGQILLSQANLGSLLYLEAERTEALLYKLERQLVDKAKSEKDIIMMRSLNSKRSLLLDMATTSYESIITFAKRNNKLRFHAKELMDPSASQAVALSTYGLGVINLHRGILPKAERLLKDSISIAKDTDFRDLLKEANQELQKLERAKQSNPSTVFMEPKGTETP
ncbi:AFR197Wp [Eremothecium gossypii ATCC 10895]|uniref:AFR197Wp n=1 Tax=Eremothecium gossypii (strain ATCC 10895 / CBS 109.51 / FGSC 9923 / NRRL Y-1056) TaxID=284811 RepID=Q753X5_EREGS|nr:AFR197Wp [Eremothecium gossypii ATCC 10895]AAS53568.1 AFR197Wp [Eremothecium gossypii ATCC 10895]AEY97881.1 FAFR197Wp [Eremothecium gossypii FDAG1]